MIGLKAPGNYSALIWNNKISICLWERAKLIICMVSGVFEPATKPQNQLFLSLETPGHLKQSRKSLQSFHYTGVDPKQHAFGNFEGGNTHLGRGGITVNSDALVTSRAGTHTWAEVGSLIW